MPANRAHALVAYLNSISTSYPFGVPKRQRVGTKGKETLRALFIGTATDDSIEARALFEAAVTKGLKFRLDQVSLVLLSDDDARGSALETVVKEKPAERVVILGRQAAAHLNGEPFEALRKLSPTVAGVSTLVTCSLSEVVSESKRKREFWNDLQRILASDCAK